jgi:hypothetical protein
VPTTAQLYVELWVSLASLLRSYTAAHGLNGNLQATVELGEERITVRHGNAWLELERRGARINWRREDGRGGELELTEAGRLREPRSQNRDLGHPVVEEMDLGHPIVEEMDLGHPIEEEMDMAAEAWARELMHE